MVSAEDFFWYASVFIFLPWLLLMAAPNWRYTEPVAFGAALVLLVAAAYYTFSHLLSASVEGGLFSFDGLKNLFRSPSMVLSGWLNYLSFGLLVGLWQVHDARQVQLAHILVLPCLLLTLLAGPTGLLLYLVLRFFKTRSWELKG